jgi:hypothetical protein
MSLDDAGRDRLLRIRLERQLGFKTLQAWRSYRRPYPHADLVRRILWLVVSGRGAIVKRIEVDLSVLKETRPHEYAVRFLFGGLCTVFAGLIAKHFGPGVGGLFLAFPAIFPAGTSLIESHEKRRKAQINSDGTNRGRVAASLDAAGASVGCIGLLGFAFLLWKGLNTHSAAVTVSAAGMVWLLLSYALWTILASRVLTFR